MKLEPTDCRMVNVTSLRTRHPATLSKWVDSWINCRGVWSGLTVADGWLQLRVIPKERSTFYFGSTGGGVWCTTDAGITWRNLSDGFFHRAAVGAIALAPSEPSVIYVGMGESTIRNNASSRQRRLPVGERGADLDPSGPGGDPHISRVLVDPADPDVAYIAALGHAHGPNPERGVYRTCDGGASWELVLHRGEDAGAADLCMDPRNPRILYATLWQGRRLPWHLDSGGPGSGLWRSVDGGDTWDDLSRQPACPRGSWAGPE